MDAWRENAALIWLCVAALTVLPELFFRRYVLMWFSVGAGCAAVLALCFVPWWGQGAAFAAVSVSLTVLFRRARRVMRCADAWDVLHPPDEEVTDADPETKGE